MALKLMFITNDKHVAQIAEKNGVDWIFIDLEINGKVERQGHLDTVISRHSMEDVKKIKSVLTTSKLLVRINPMYIGTEEEIDKVIQYGGDIIMLPYFRNKSEVEAFIDFIAGRAKVCLLLETPEAVENIDYILDTPGIDYIHIGLNDLHLGYGMKFMFEVLADGTVERLCKKIGDRNIAYGFGGIAQLGKGDLKAEYIIGEHYRLGSSMVILSRSFYNASNVNEVNDTSKTEKEFHHGVGAIRKYESSLENKEKEFFEKNKKRVQDSINTIVERLGS